MKLSVKQKMHLFAIGCVSGVVAIGAFILLNIGIKNTEIKSRFGDMKDISASIIVPLGIWFWAVINRGGTDQRYLSSFRTGFVLGALLTSFFALSNEDSLPDVSVVQKILRIIGASALAGVVYRLLMGKHTEDK